MGFTLKIDEELCQGCGNCIVVCPVSALGDICIAGGLGSRTRETFGVSAGAVEIYDPGFCTGCGSCVRACGYDAIQISAQKPREMEKRQSYDEMSMKGGKARVYNLIKYEGPLTIEQAARSLDLPSKLAASLIHTLKSEGRVFEADRLEENSKVAYTYTTEAPEPVEEDKAGAEANVRVDHEKAEQMRKNLLTAMESFSTPKMKNMLEMGRLEKVKKELAARLKER